MNAKKLDHLNILDIGNSLQFAGVIYSGPKEHYHCYIAEDLDPEAEHKALPMSSQDWEKVICQTDLMETEVLGKSEDRKICKILIRKSTRQIKQGVSWKVYHRDNYQCRYCAIQGVPMTVDHLVLWEDGGPSIEDNLITACRKCNKTRGNMGCSDWLNSKYYLEKSKNVTEEVRASNCAYHGDYACTCGNHALYRNVLAKGVLKLLKKN